MITVYSISCPLVNVNETKNDIFVDEKTTRPIVCYFRTGPLNNINFSFKKMLTLTKINKLEAFLIVS